MKRDLSLNELHPEELLAKASRGALDAHEAADLRAHCARCPACALQIELRGEIESALAPTALEYEIGARAVERLFGSRLLESARAATREHGPRRGPRLATRAALVLALLLGTSVIASAFVLGTRGRLWDVAGPDREGPRAPAGHARHASSAGGRAPEAEPKTLEDGSPAPTPSAPSPVAAPSTAVAPLAPTPVAAPTAAVAPPAPTPVAAPTAAVAVPAVAPPAVGPPPASLPSPPVILARPMSRRGALTTSDGSGAEPGAAAIFGAAERARGDGELVDARRLYGQLASRFRGTREELSARVLGGQMLLDDLDEPAAALRAFDGYLRDEPGGTLAEEAVVGRAQALRRLGRAAAEAAAWNDLLVRYPRSVHAELARERLAALVPAP
jgi:hypothetical protein